MRIKRIVAMLLAMLLVLGLCACGSKAETAPVEETPVEQAPTWQEQYDLGIRYLSEGNYKEAIIAFEAAIKIDPKRAEGYLSLAEAYTGMGDVEAAKKTLEDALGQVEDPAALEAKLTELSNIRVPLEGYPKTVRKDWDDGRYMIWEYDQYGDSVGTRYTADGQMEYRVEWTYDVTGAKTCKENWYDPEAAQKERIAEYDAEGRLSREVEYWEDDTKTFVYTYQGGEAVVEMEIVGEKYGEIRDSYHHTLGEGAHYLEIWGMGYSSDGINVGHVVEFDEQGDMIRDIELWED